MSEGVFPSFSSGLAKVEALICNDEIRRFRYFSVILTARRPRKGR
jgi:hypothetical protein